MNPLANEAVKGLLKAQSQEDIECILRGIELDDSLEIIRLLLARYNNMVIQAHMELMMKD